MIRSLTSAELDLYRTIRTEALRSDPDAFGETIELFEARPGDELRGWFDDHVSGDRGILVDVADGVPRAMCGWGVKLPEGFLWGLFVSPGARRRGIGEKLMLEAARIVAGRGVRVLQAHVAAPNEDAIRFYRDVGFRVAGEVGVLREGSDVSVYRVETTVEALLGSHGDAAPGETRRAPGRAS